MDKKLIDKSKFIIPKKTPNNNPTPVASGAIDPQALLSRLEKDLKRFLDTNEMCPIR